MKLVLLVASLLFSKLCWSQDKVEWSFFVKKLEKNLYEVHFTPTVLSGWHIYSLNTIDDSAVPTQFTYDKNSKIKTDGEVEEVPLQKDFIQRVKLMRSRKAYLSGSIHYMACSDLECLPPVTKRFRISVGE